MPGIYHQYGNDLAVGPTGDIATTDQPTLTQQRVIRRLVTNLGDDLWQLGYGGGLAQLVGQPASQLAIQAIIRSQIMKEASVAVSPEPTITVSVNSSGIVYAFIKYIDVDTGSPVTITTPIG